MEERDQIAGVMKKRLQVATRKQIPSQQEIRFYSEVLFFSIFNTLWFIRFSFQLFNMIETTFQH